MDDPPPSIPDPNARSFVVKVWLEEASTGRIGARWRGHVTQVSNGQRTYFHHLEDISLVILPHLEALGVRFGTIWRIRQWLYRHGG